MITKLCPYVQKDNHCQIDGFECIYSDYYFCNVYSHFSQQDANGVRNVSSLKDARAMTAGIFQSGNLIIESLSQNPRVGQEQLRDWGIPVGGDFKDGL